MLVRWVSTVRRARCSRSGVSVFVRPTPASSAMRRSLPVRAPEPVRAAAGTLAPRPPVVGEVAKVRFIVESAHATGADEQVGISESEFFGPSNANRS
ncbi:hypothetical protein [Streptomyces sp. NPDC051109]|uniref:hypothetical protein n=1 Tax=Streptomyces sp. NPDC051109 TaxID=3365642 RepID=UPI003789D059